MRKCKTAKDSAQVKKSVTRKYFVLHCHVMKKPTKRAPGKTTLTISLPTELKKAIEDAAASDQRTTSNFIVVELAKLVAQQGIDKTRPEKL